ncbi:MAG: hypothetical protein WCZ89_07320 [Phycisphaerae bacterium]
MFKDETKSSQMRQVDCSIGDLPRNNIEQLLLSIISFTKTRQKILTQNIRNVDCDGYCPVDLPAQEFAEILASALNEHVSRNRLVFCDSDNVRFGQKGSFYTKPVADGQAKSLLSKDKEKYIRTQAEKLVENSLNQKLAMMLLNNKPQEAFVSE